MIDHIIHSYRLRSRRQRLRDAGMLTPAETAKQLGINLHTVKHWRRAGIVRGLCYNDKGECFSTRPTPTTRRNDPRSDDPPKRGDQHKHETPTHQPEKVQYATRGLSLGFRARAGSIRVP